MLLKDGHKYTDGFGKTYHIMGRTRYYPEFVWSLCGNWYERSTGNFVSYNPKDGYFVIPFCERSLVSEYNDKEG